MTDVFAAFTVVSFAMFLILLLTFLIDTFTRVGQELWWRWKERRDE